MQKDIGSDEVRSLFLVWLLNWVTFTP